MQVIDIGPPDAKIMIVGEAPGEEEERKGEPFVGQSGKLLKSMLNHSGINFSKCYVTNIVNTRPPDNKFGYLYEKASRRVPSRRLEDAWFALREKIKRIRPNVVIALGGEPLRAITGRMKISSWRGSVLKFDGIKIIPTYHPAAVLREYKFHVVVEIDFAKAAKESLTSEHIEPTVEINPFPSLEDICKWTDNIKDGDRVAFDLETVGTTIRRVGLANGMSAISVPFIQFKSNELTTPAKTSIIHISSMSSSQTSYWPLDKEVCVVEQLAKIFANSNIQKVGQNSINFDQPLLEEQFGIRINNHYLDTMHAWHVLYPELPKSLNFICTVLTPFSNYWSDKVTEDDYQEGVYNCKDAIVTWYASKKIETELRTSNLHDFYFNTVHKLSFALACAQRHGVLVDTEERDRKTKKYENRVDVISKEVKEITEQDLNINSPTQMKRLLYDKLRFPTIYKDGKPTTDENALKTLLKRYPDERILHLIIEYRKASKMISTFLTAELDNDNKMRTSYDASGTETGRISSSKNKIVDRGMNLQNIPVDKPQRNQEGLRDLFIAPPGCSFVKGDLVQAETMVTAEILYRHGFGVLREKYKDPNFDIHRWFASKIFGVSEDSITKPQRDIGKLGNHSGNYVAGPKVLQNAALKDNIDGIDYRRAQQILDTRHAAIPGLKEWWDAVERQLRRTRTITTCLGRRRIFFGRLDASTLRDAVAFEPQSTVGDVCNKICIKLWQCLDSDCYLILQVHDEIVVECPDDKIDKVVRIMQESANIPLHINKEPLIIPIEVAVGKNWRDCKKV